MGPHLGRLYSKDLPHPTTHYFSRIYLLVYFSHLFEQGDQKTLQDVQYLLYQVFPISDFDFPFLVTGYIVTTIDPCSTHSAIRCSWHLYLRKKYWPVRWYICWCAVATASR